MRHNVILAAAALTLGLTLGGCDSFDPLDKFQDWDIMGANKKPLQGERRAVFPEGVPGVPQGVPRELVKGYEAPAEPPQVVVEKPKPKPKKVAARPKPKRPPAEAAQPQQAAPAQAVQPAGAWPAPAPPPPQSNAGAWPTIPGSQPTWPSQAPPPATR
jgi:hypothetical protein